MLFFAVERGFLTVKVSNRKPTCDKNNSTLDSAEIKFCIIRFSSVGFNISKNFKLHKKFKTFLLRNILDKNEWSYFLKRCYYEKNDPDLVSIFHVIIYH